MRDFLAGSDVAHHGLIIGSCFTETTFINESLTCMIKPRVNAYALYLVNTRLISKLIRFLRCDPG